MERGRNIRRSHDARPYLLVSIPPQMSVSTFMEYLKGKSAMMIFDRNANLKYKFGNRNFWATGYYVRTEGLNEATIKKYIREQETADVAEDKEMKKEKALDAIIKNQKANITNP